MRTYQYNLKGKTFGELIELSFGESIEFCIQSAFDSVLIYEGVQKGMGPEEIAEAVTAKKIFFFPYADPLGRVWFFCCKECAATGEAEPLGFYREWSMN